MSTLINEIFKLNPVILEAQEEEEDEDEAVEGTGGDAEADDENVRPAPKV